MPRAAAPDAQFPSANRAIPPPLPLHAKHDATRAPRFWHAAVSATKGLFNQPTRIAGDWVLTSWLLFSVPPAEGRHKCVRRSTSTPALRAIANASSSNLRREMANNPSPALPSLFTTKRSFDQSPRKLKSKASAPSLAARRLAISSPSLPKPLDSLDSPHPKLAYPLSPMPSPVGSTFSLKTPGPQLTSQSQLAQMDGASSTSSDSCNESRPVRRRTKSAPGAKFGRRSLFSPALLAAQDPATPSIESSSPIVIDIASPSIASPGSTGSIPSPPLETPKMTLDYFTHKSSPLAHVASPRSFTSIKRKPVPRHLYMDPPEHDASAPCTPVLTPIPNSSPNMNVSSSVSRKESSNTLHTPLLPSSELILKACTSSRLNSRGLNLLPIGQTASANAVRRQHRRSVSEQGCRRLLSADVLPSPWYTTNASGSMTPLITPAEEQAPFSFANDLPAAPRVLRQSPPQTPNHITEEVSAFSDNTSVRSSVCRGGALSPLTDDEVDAIRSFLRRHATGHRARQRRKAVRPRSSRSRDTSVASCSYDMHTQILESYATDDDEVFSIDYSEDDADAESHLPMSASETHSTSTASVDDLHASTDDGELGEGAKDFDVETPIIRDEIETPIDTGNRGTFGYYGTPVVRKPSSCRELAAAYARIPCDGEMESRPSLPAEWVNHGSTEDMSEISKPSREEGTSQSGEIDSDTLEDASNRTPVAGPLRSSSLYYRSSSDYAQQSDDDDGLSYLRASRQPLVPRMINSDSESDRPISCSTSSLSTSTSTGRSAFASGIGLAIIPPEHFAYFDKFANYEYVAPYTPSEFGTDGSEGSVTRLECASPRMQRGCGMRCNNSFDALKTDLTSLQTQKTSASDAKSGTNLASLVLKPALQINARRADGSKIVQLPSPNDTVEIAYPLQTSVNMQRMAACSASADEALPENVKSFMNLTPNEPRPKRTRVKLRQLFSRSNLKSATRRKVSA
ncbi:hypothetical protein ACEPAF_7601 [Sanghuangporus sanghuang]